MASTRDVLEEVLLDENAEPMQLTLSLVQSITDNFSDKMRLGKGGSADVYKGVLGIGTMVAVKKLSARDIEDKLFNKEFECLMKARHKNIVRFLGYCSDTQGSAGEFGGKAVIAEQRNRVLCFEYASEGSLDSKISDASGGLNWNIRYQIIYGICEGLHYLHENQFLHLDLKPANILLDGKMVPKLADFGLARRLDQNKSHATATTIMGTPGYFAPEIFNKQSTTMLDIYSLGVTIMEILTGKIQLYYEVENVIESWMDRSGKLKEDIPMQQVRTCAEIGIMCMDNKPENRPTTQHIIKKLKEVGVPESGEGGGNTSLAHMVEASDGSKLLRIHPLHLWFPVESDRAMISCPLHLKNYTDDHIAFRILTTKIGKKNFKGPLCGIVPPRSVYTVAVTMCSQLELPSTGKEFLTLESSVDVYQELQKSYDIHNGHGYSSRQLAERIEKNYSLLNRLFSAAKGNSFDLHRLKLTAAYMAPGLVRAELKSKITISPLARDIKCIDVHPKEPWILTGHKSCLVQIRDCNTQEIVKSFHINQYKWGSYEVEDVKFILSTELLVAAATKRCIGIWSFASDKLIFIQRIYVVSSYCDRVRIAIQPTHPPHLLAMGCTGIAIWDWEAKKRLYFLDLVEPGRLILDSPCARFNPEDPTSFGLALNNNEVQIQNTFGDHGITVISNHEKFGPLCLDYFTRDDVLYMIIGCKDTTAKIWDCRTGNWVQTLKGHSAWVTSVCSCSDLPILITGSNDGTVRLWSSATFEVQGVINYGLEGIQEICYLKDSKRIVTKHSVGFAITEIDH